MNSKHPNAILFVNLQGISHTICTVNERIATSPVTHPGFDLTAINKPEELFELSPVSSPYEFDQIFDCKGFFSKRLSKLKLKQLKILDPVIRAMLKPGERVFYLTDGIKVNSFEQMFIGWIMYYYNHNAFIFTSERILLIHLTGKKKIGKFVGVIHYQDLLQAKPSSFGSLQLKFRNKKRIIFSRVARKDRKFIKSFLTPLIQENAKHVDKEASAITDLCPACYEPVLKKDACACGHCESEFRTPKQAALRSLLLPGLGDIYLGSRLGYLEIAFMLILWISLIVGNIQLIADGEDPAGVWTGTLFFMGVIHVIDAFKAHYVASKGIFPKEKIEAIRERQQAAV